MKRFMQSAARSLLCLLLVAVLLLSGTSCARSAESLPAQEVRVLSQNLLTGSAESIASRAPTMINYMRSLELDSIGVQECVAKWADALDAGLGDKYARVGVECGKGEDKGSFATYVYYLKDKYRVIATDTFWLSTTPDVPSKYSETVDMNRTCTWVILEDMQTGFRYVHVNCHADWMDPSVNVVQIQMIRDVILRFEQMGYPVFATGDYNTPEGSISYGQMLADERIGDARYEAESTDDTVMAVNGEKPIDYCFVTREKMDVLEYKIIENLHEGVTVSDHHGVYTRAAVHSLPVQDHRIALPNFEDGAMVRATNDPVFSSHMRLTLTQAKSADGSVAQTYGLALVNTDGKTVFEGTAYGSAQRPLQPVTLSTAITSELPTGTYRLEITPYSLLGEPGETLVRDLLWQGEDQTPKKPAAPDILDLSVKNGAVTDSSPNRMEMLQIGEVNVTENSMEFSKKGNIRTPSLTNYYGDMIDGFTLTATIRTGSEVAGGLPYICNHHAGGFGITATNGMLSFDVHNGTKYIGTRVSVQPNTVYHVSGIYDGAMIHIFLNGEHASSAVLGGNMAIPTNYGARYLCLGADSNMDGTGEYPSEVTVYETALYSAILTDKEVRYLAESDEWI